MNLRKGFSTMRCVDVIRELAAPTDTQDAAALADHLSHCTSCAAFAERAARLDRLWEATRPAEPTPEVWYNLWLQVAHSLDSSASQPIVPLSPAGVRNGSTTASEMKFDIKPGGQTRSRSSYSRPWARIGIVRLSRVAAAVLIAGLGWWFFVRSKQQFASLNPASPNPTGPGAMLTSLPDVDIEAGHTVVILADPKGPSRG